MIAIFGKKVLMATAAGGLMMTAACGGGDEPKQAKSGAANQAAPAQNAAAPAGGSAKADAPAPDNVETVSGVTFASVTGNAGAGEAVFAQCKTCHVTDPGVNRIGPSLHGIVGRPAGQVAGYTYSPANANSGITWSPEKLFQYLENPQRVVPGTKMAFAGIPDPQRRADLIAWLETQGGSGGGAAAGNAAQPKS